MLKIGDAFVNDGDFVCPRCHADPRGRRWLHVQRAPPDQRACGQCPAGGVSGASPATGEAAHMSLKAIITQPNMNMCSASGRPRCRWVCFFIRFVEMCLSNGCSAVNGCRQNESQWMLCSEWVPSEWESDTNITIIHTTPVHQLTSGEDKRWNKSSIKTFLTSNCCFQLK